MSLKEDILKKLEEKEQGFMLAELYGTFEVVELLDEVINLIEEGKIEIINHNRIKLA
jgi:hypothetical protein